MSFVYYDYHPVTLDRIAKDDYAGVIKQRRHTMLWDPCASHWRYKQWHFSRKCSRLHHRTGLTTKAMAISEVLELESKHRCYDCVIPTTATDRLYLERGRTLRHGLSDMKDVLESARLAIESLSPTTTSWLDSVDEDDPPQAPSVNGTILRLDRAVGTLLGLRADDPSLAGTIDPLVEQAKAAFAALVGSVTIPVVKADVVVGEFLSDWELENHWSAGVVELLREHCDYDVGESLFNLWVSAFQHGRRGKAAFESVREAEFDEDDDYGIWFFVWESLSAAKKGRDIALQVLEWEAKALALLPAVESYPSETVTLSRGTQEPYQYGPWLWPIHGLMSLADPTVSVEVSFAGPAAARRRKGAGIELLNQYKAEARAHWEATQRH